MSQHEARRPSSIQIIDEIQTQSELSNAEQWKIIRQKSREEAQKRKQARLDNLDQTTQRMINEAQKEIPKLCAKSDFVSLCYCIRGGVKSNLDALSARQTPLGMRRITFRSYGTLDNSPNSSANGNTGAEANMKKADRISDVEANKQQAKKRRKLRQQMLATKMQMSILKAKLGIIYMCICIYDEQKNIEVALAELKETEKLEDIAEETSSMSPLPSEESVLGNADKEESSGKDKHQSRISSVSFSINSLDIFEKELIEAIGQVESMRQELKQVGPDPNN
ncbi:hypothetical protein RFI_20029, partial [Reticulomyxa filosa]